MPTPPKIFDRDLIRRRLERAADGDKFVRRLCLEDLGSRLLTLSRTFDRALMISPDADGLPATGMTGKGEFAYRHAATARTSGGVPLLDPENLVLPETGYDLIVSLLDLQVVNDVPGFLTRIRYSLAPDGLFLAAMLGGDTLTELRRAFLTADAEVSGGAFARVVPFIQLSDAGPLLQRTGFALPVTDIESHTIRYANPLALMADLKAMGASNPLADRPDRLATPKLLAAASAAYEETAGDPDGRVRATLEIVWLSGWAPHDSQQKPLKPGSATISLTKVLGKS